ncbi:hypothetical protein COT30_04165 [Candidatus Micrarchaeota archaeon CG08_land_8_20_14_0_20_49_17]|nr:MAG: hypothetical protein COT30_04165 [Candidatus Micrarchaeota archaeon CG08_land_8_20_14_0_20_49_17]PIU81689.1 MAG: hypothetical protein COS70_02785 [Candidatus Micrarchaeota archaeon CG06_land_8_20_14_3_00_50_6]PIZ92359.1 MAG: hypothetical protein COX84_06940 [Candidatus Micrarchaeota archaeon CG_4_10_14_0_2_um_filter_49_7]
MAGERSIMGDLLHNIKRILEKKDLPYSGAHQEVSVGQRWADIVLYDLQNKPVLVIELKKPDGKPIHDPYSPDVVEQACRYASALGAGYFVTTSLRHFVLWKTFEEGTPLLQRQLLHYQAAIPLDTTIRQILSDLPLVKDGKIRFLGIDWKFIRRLTTFHDVLWPKLMESIEEKAKRDDKFKNEYIEWLYEQEFAYSTETNEKIAKQYAHLLSNKLFFYKLLEGNFPELPKLVRIETVDEQKFKQSLNNYFAKALEIDYEAVFSPSFMDNVPLNVESISLFNDFILELERYKLSEIEYDIIGRVFESLIPEEERYYLGQYYTRADVVDLIEELCINSADDTIFDPACGSGTFLVRAYYALKRKGKEKKHRELLAQIYGEDINQFAAHLSVINLTIRDLSQLTNKVNILVNDFFNLRPTLSVLLPFSGKNVRNKTQTINIPRFDVVVANPPYTRQEELGEYSETYKDKLAAALQDDWGQKYVLGKRAGIHAYFLLHAAKFLKPRGRLGFIVSNSWMDADYGAEIQKMLLENFRLKAIIESKVERWFEDAAVNTCIIIAERDDDPETRQKNPVKFVLLKKPLPDCQFGAVAQKIAEAKELYEDDALCVCPVSQAELWQAGLAENAKGKLEWRGGKWGKYLRAPAVFFKILKQKDKLQLLPELAELKYGIKTGLTEFFVKSRRSFKKFGVEQRFLKPILHSTRELIKPILKEEQIQNMLFSTRLDKVALRGTTALAFIKMGEVMGFSKRKSVESRQLWYDSGTQEPPPIILTCFYNERHFAVFNKDDIQIENAFFGLFPKEGISPIALAAYLNSSLFALTKELYGRLNLGEGVLTIYGPDWKQMPVLDLGMLSKEQMQALEKAFLRLGRQEILPVSEAIKTKPQLDLDKIVFDIFGLSQKERKEVYSALVELVTERITKAKSVKRNGNGNGNGRRKKKAAVGNENNENELQGRQNQQSNLVQFIL